MATKKETPNVQEPTSQPVAEPVAPPMPQAGYPQQYAAPGYAPAYVDPNKGKAKWLTFEYIVALGSLVTSVLLSVEVLIALTKVWFGGGRVLNTSVTGWVSDFLGLGTSTPGTNIVATAVGAVLFGVIAFIVFGRVSKAIPARPGYTGRTAYKVATYAAFGALILPAIILSAKLASVLVNSLLFIGVSGAGSIYKQLYLGEFLPYAVGLGLIVATAFFVGKIIQGANKSKPAVLIALCVAGAMLIGAAITTAVQVHDSGSVRDGGSTTLPSYDSGSSSEQYKIPTLDLDSLKDL